MWIFLNNAFYSVVLDKEFGPKSDRLVLRARLKGDIEKHFPLKEVFETNEADYRFRTYISKSEYKALLNKIVDDMDYTNFKNSVEDKNRAKLYSYVWSEMWIAQSDEQRKAGVELRWIEDYYSQKNKNKKKQIG